MKSIYICHTHVEMYLPYTCRYMPVIHMSRCVCHTHVGMCATQTSKCVCHTHVEMCLPYTYQHVYDRQMFPGKYILLSSTENDEIVFRANDVLTRRWSHGTGGQAPVSQHGIHVRFVEDRVALQHVFLRTPSRPLSVKLHQTPIFSNSTTLHCNRTNWHQLTHTLRHLSCCCCDCSLWLVWPWLVQR
jgi:hypothetical protein